MSKSLAKQVSRLAGHKCAGHRRCHAGRIHHRQANAHEPRSASACAGIRVAALCGGRGGQPGGQHCRAGRTGAATRQVGAVGPIDEAGQRPAQHAGGRRHQFGPASSPARDGRRRKKRASLAQMGLRFPQQMARIDTLTRAPVDGDTEARILDYARENIAAVDAVLLSHYHGGLLTPSLAATLRQLCARRDVLLTADAQGDFEAFSGVDVIKCNADEARRALNRQLRSDSDFRQAALDLHARLGVKRATVITRGGARRDPGAGGRNPALPIFRGSWMSLIRSARATRQSRSSRLGLAAGLVGAGVGLARQRGQRHRRSASRQLRAHCR